jgi:hypothetical protein
MNKTNLKRYAPQARKDFIAAVTARAQLLGLSEVGGTPQAEPCTVNGEVAVIAGRPWPASVQGKRERLFQRMKRDGFSATLEAVAYTWFNRFAALRYMELHDYLGHGRRVLSNPEGGLPEALAYALDLAEAGDLPGLRPDAVRQFKLDNQDSELFRRVLVAQCNALHGAMPFLFERIDDDSELLLPDNLLRSDSVIAKLVEEIPEEDWAEVEIIGWLYQFYISEKKDQVIGKVVKSEDIPAATQLFTPNWIVQYLVQNSLGRLWLMANPQSTLAKEWPYYITPAEQTPEVQAQLDALIQTRVREDGDALNPESITVLDPACGSGHILVVAYDVLKAIYLERGYQPRAIPRLILEKNLYGLDIDDRAAQMAGFALLMKARADDRRLFTATDEAGNVQPPKLNVLSLQESKGLRVDELATHLAPFKVQRATITALVEPFEHAKTFGSLIQIPYALKTHLAVLPEMLAVVKHSGDMYATAAADDLLPLVQQAQVLAMKFDAVMANPPYMGRKNMDSDVKTFAQRNYLNACSDLYACFIERSFTHARDSCTISMVTMQGWMFLSSFEEFRKNLLECKTISSMAHIGYNSFPSLNSKIAQAVAFSFINKDLVGLVGDFIDLNSAPQAADKDEVFRARDPKNHYKLIASSMASIPASPVAYWASPKMIGHFKSKPPLKSIASSRPGLSTTDNGRFLRLWHEISLTTLGLSQSDRSSAASSSYRWFPFNKGGAFRKWFGNNEVVVNWENDGSEIRAAAEGAGGGRIVSSEFYFQESLSMSSITTGTNTCRYYPVGALPDANLLSIYGLSARERLKLLGYLNSNTTARYLAFLSPTIKLNACDLDRLPYDKSFEFDGSAVEEMIGIARLDWNSFERSWDFQSLPMIAVSQSENLIRESYRKWRDASEMAVDRMKFLEENNNRLFIENFDLSDELSHEVSLDQITLTVNAAYRYGGGQSAVELESRFLLETAEDFVSYAIGCMMGRYSLDEPGLIFAHAGNVGFEPGRYATFPADADGIVPITDELWFADDACSRIREFLRAVWGQGTLEENMAWLAESLGTKASETPDETIRRYLADKFFKDHLQTYKKRPIYWLFSSGKQGAFQALVYLHRYHEGTLARMRAEYVVPLTGKILSRIEMLQKDALAAASTAARNKLAKEVEKLKKKHVELLAYDEQLRHYADMRITLDLDDGVKVNYGKFGDLLEGVKVVTGGAGDD